MKRVFELGKEYVDTHPNVRLVLGILYIIGTITFLHVYLGFLWTAGICLFSLCIWASGPWITHDEYLIRYDPQAYTAKRFTNPDGTPKKPFRESGPGESFGDTRLLAPALKSLLDVSKEDRQSQAASRAL